MIDVRRVIKTTVLWISIVYVICFAGVALIPGVRSGFMLYALHTNLDLGQNVTGFSTFISGLIIWNIIGVLGVWLFVWIFNKTASK